MLSDARMAVVRILQRHGGAVEDDDGFAVAPLLNEIGADPRSFNALLRHMDADGQIKRKIRGKRTYRIELTWQPEEEESGPAVEEPIEELAEEPEEPVEDEEDEVEEEEVSATTAPSALDADRVDALVDRMLDVVFDIVTENSDRIRDAFLVILREEADDELRGENQSEAEGTGT